MLLQPCNNLFLIGCNNLGNTMDLQRFPPCFNLVATSYNMLKYWISGTVIMYSYMASTCNGLVNSILGMYKLLLPWVYRYIGHLIASLVRMHSTVDLMYKLICWFVLYLYSHLSFVLIILHHLLVGCRLLFDNQFTINMQGYYNFTRLWTPCKWCHNHNPAL